MHNNELLKLCRRLPDEDLRSHLAFTDYKDTSRHVRDEVVAILFFELLATDNKDRYGVVSAALSRRILIKAGQFVHRSSIVRNHFGKFEHARHELASFIWQCLLEREGDRDHAQRLFGQLFLRRALDFEEQFRAKKRANQDSLDQIAEGRDGDSSEPANVIEALRDDRAPEKLFEKRQRVLDLLSCMQDVLTPDEFTTLEMLYFYDFQVASDDPEIETVASVLGVTRRTVQNYEKRALEKLKKELEK